MNYCFNAIVDSFDMPSGFWVVRVFIVISPPFLYHHKGIVLPFSLNGSVTAKHWEL